MQILFISCVVCKHYGDMKFLSNPCCHISDHNGMMNMNQINIKC